MGLKPSGRNAGRRRRPTRARLSDTCLRTTREATTAAPPTRTFERVARGASARHPSLRALSVPTFCPRASVVRALGRQFVVVRRDASLGRDAVRRARVGGGDLLRVRRDVVGPGRRRNSRPRRRGVGRGVRVGRGCVCRVSRVASSRPVPRRGPPTPEGGLPHTTRPVHIQRRLRARRRRPHALRRPAHRARQAPGGAAQPHRRRERARHPLLRIVRRERRRRRTPTRARLVLARPPPPLARGGPRLSPHPRASDRRGCLRRRRRSRGGSS